MAEDQTTTELFGNEGGSPLTSTTEVPETDHPEKDESAKTTSDEESNDEPLFSEKKVEEKQRETRDEVAERHAQSWADKIASGEVTIADLPKRQQYLLSRIENKLDLLKPDESPDIEATVDQIVEKKLLEKEDRNNYEKTVKQLNAMGLTSAQKATIKAEFNELSALPDSIAIVKAAKLAGVDLDKDPRMDDMFIPNSGATPVKVDKQTEKERMTEIYNRANNFS